MKGLKKIFITLLFRDAVGSDVIYLCKFFMVKTRFFVSIYQVTKLRNLQLKFNKRDIKAIDIKAIISY
ncbi:MAG: hypothetical protein QXR88_00850 [Candidatus Pacearchaeota archaeon]